MTRRGGWRSQKEFESIRGDQDSPLGSSTQALPDSRWSSALLKFDALSVRNYRIFFFGQMVSSTGTWVQWVAQSWLIIKLGGVGLEVGLASALQLMPVVFGAAWGGLVADRFDKHRTLILLQFAAGGVILGLAAVTASGAVRIWMVYVVAILLGCVNTLEFPARLSFVFELVGEEKVPNATALNGAQYSATKILGAAVAGVLIEWIGLAWAFGINGVSYFVIAASLLVMNRESLHKPSLLKRSDGQIRAGIRYVWRSNDLRWTATAVAAVAILTMNWQVVLPLLAQSEFDGGAGTFAVLASLMGVGAVVGGVATAWHARFTIGLWGTIGVLVGVSVILAAFAPTLHWTAAILMVEGGLSVSFMTMSHSIMLLTAPADARGRVLSIYITAAFVGGLVGGPAIGWVADVWSSRAALGLCGIIIVVAVWAAHRRRRLQPHEQIGPVDGFSETAQIG